MENKIYNERRIVIMRKFILLMAFTGLLMLPACANAVAGNTPPLVDPSTELASTIPSLPANEPTTPAPSEPELIDDREEFRPVSMLQLEPLVEGERLAILHTNMGDITLRFFPTEAPKAVENFITHAENGFYDGLTFHRVIPNFMIQGGCPLGNGTGGESIWGEGFGQEYSPNLRHFRGALAMAQSALPNSIRSQFYIVQNNSLRSDFRTEFEWILENMDEVIGQTPEGLPLTGRDLHTEDELRYLIDNGGTPHLDRMFNPNFHTVFGHVVEGMDIVDAIANVQTGANDRPVEPVIINNISFIIYGE